MAVRERAASSAQAVGQAGKELLRPPDLWASRQAAPVERLRYARYGEHTPPGGLGRTLKLGYTYAVSLPVSVAAGAVSWLFERPARAGLFLVTVVAVWLTGAGQAVAVAVAWALRLLADWIVL